MSTWIWVVASLLGVAIFGLGMLTSWALRQKQDVHRPQLLLGVFFAIVALIVTIDTVTLQVQFHRHVNETMPIQNAQLECNQRQNDALVVIGRTRKNVDTAALNYDQALQLFLSASSRDREPGDPLVINLQAALDVLVAARIKATEAYEKNPFPNC